MSRPHPLTPPGGWISTLFQKAKAALDSHRTCATRFDRHRRFLAGLADPRFHLVDLLSGQVESFRVAHGRGSDPDHRGFVERFSNQPGSEATSNGTYTTAEYYHGKYGLSMKVQGLDWTNSNAESRAIVIHNAWYAEPEMIDIHGKLGRTEGCFAFSRARPVESHEQAGRRPDDLCGKAGRLG